MLKEPIRGTLDYAEPLENVGGFVCPLCWLEGTATLLSDDGDRRHFTCQHHRNAMTRICKGGRRGLLEAVRIAALLLDAGAPENTIVWWDVTRDPRKLRPGKGG